MMGGLDGASQERKELALCITAVLLVLLTALDVVRSPHQQGGISSEEEDDGVPASRRRGGDVTTAKYISDVTRDTPVFQTRRLRPYLSNLLGNVSIAYNQSVDGLQSVWLTLPNVRHQREDRRRVKAVRPSLPSWAEYRVIEPNQRRVDFATFTSSMDSFMNRFQAADHLDSFADNITYATNSADKIAYQLRNFEPMHHRFSSPQWNGISLAAQRKLGSVHPKGFMIGISSVSRQTNYLMSTMTSFLGALSDEEKFLVHFVIFNGNYPPDQHEDVALLRMQFSMEIANGLIEIVELKSPHPQLRDPSRLARRWGDDLARVQWRSKQVLDVAYLMEYCAEHHLGYNYFLMMEDDIIASKNFARRLRTWLDAHMLRNTDWTMLSFYNPWPVQDMEQLPPNKFFGVIGQLFRVHDLPVVVEFLRKNFDQSPLDWLFVDFLKKAGGSIVVHTPSFFQHQGTVSSLSGKEQEGRSVDFVDSE